MRNRRASQLIDVLESQVDEWLKALDTFVRWAADREPVDKSLIDKLEVCSLFLGVTCHVVLRLHTFSDRPQFGWQVIGRRVFESRKMRDHASDQLAKRQGSLLVLVADQIDVGADLNTVAGSIDLVEMFKRRIHCPLQALGCATYGKGDAIAHLDCHLNGFGAGAGNIDRDRVIWVGIEPAKLRRPSVTFYGVTIKVGPEPFDKRFELRGGAITFSNVRETRVTPADAAQRATAGLCRQRSQSAGEYSRIASNGVGDAGADPKALCSRPGEVELSDRIRGQVLGVGTEQNIEAQSLRLRGQLRGVARAGLHHNTEFRHASSMCSMRRFRAHLNPFPAVRQWFEYF